MERSRHSNRSSPASAPVSYQISSLIRSNSQNSSDSGRHRSGSVDRVREAEKELLERHREAAMLGGGGGDVKVKESRSPGKEASERRSGGDDAVKSARQSPSPYSKAALGEAGMKMAGGGPPPTLKDGERKDTPATDLMLKVKNDMKIKEERKEEQEVMVVSSEPASHPPPAPAPPIPSMHPGHPHHHHTLNTSTPARTERGSVWRRDCVTPYKPRQADRQTGTHSQSTRESVRVPKGSTFLMHTDRKSVV